MNEGKSYYFGISLDPYQKEVSAIESNSEIVEDWEGGYKLELDLKAKSDAQAWKADFKLPYAISAAYGVDLVDKGNGNYTISGQNDQVNLKQGQSIQPILIIDDSGKEALTPEFDSKLNPINEQQDSNKDQTEKSNPIDEQVVESSAIESG